ncbi:hypothetical protein AAW14_13195 [Streptomyces hygroscopicus]|uniref:hypothetical protein n=1 Tax=Streptomyces hygroscopicus TaxID=1912 RepID=UPI002240A5B2|nr:hypothetical protein [Streptomyces hygroscopicus]MCW7942975.1 hypothetical protein [Streptomyces hygroscopicus]
MSCDTPAKPAAAAEEAVLPRIVPRLHPGRWSAALVVPVLLGLAVDGVVRNELPRQKCCARGAERTR